MVNGLERERRDKQLQQFESWDRTESPPTEGKNPRLSSLRIRATEVGGSHFRKGVLSGIVGGLCCVAGALALGLGLGSVSFFSTFMGRYQMYFIAASLALMAFWLLHGVRRYLRGGADLRATARGLLRPALAMGSTWVVTLATALAIGWLAGLR